MTDWRETTSRPTNDGKGKVTTTISGPQAGLIDERRKRAILNCGGKEVSLNPADLEVLRKLRESGLGECDQVTQDIVRQERGNRWDRQPR